MNNLNLRTKIIVLLAIPIIGLIIMATVIIAESNGLSSNFDELANESLPIVTALEEIKVSGARLISSTNEFILEQQLSLEGGDEEAGAEGESEQIAQAIEDYTNALALYRTLEDPAFLASTQFYANIETYGQDLIDITTSILELDESGAAIEDIADVRANFEQAEIDFLSAVDEAIDLERQELIDGQAEVENNISNAINTISLIMVGTIVLVVVLTFYVLRSISQPISNLIITANKLREGDLSARSEIVSHDEFGLFGAAFNQMAGDIQTRQSQLVELNHTLEDRVAERTSDLKIARDEALAAQRIANENSRLKSEFLSMMSHELRTPMNAIEGFTGIMLKRMAGVEYNDKAERYLKKVQSNSHRLLGLINDFLDLSRIESGRLELANLPMSPKDMAQKWQENLSVLADNKNLVFDVSVDPNLPETIFGDEESISKIAINLVGNAIKFTETGSVTLSLQQQGQQMAIEVHDTGVGIPPHARDFVFEEFRQVDQSSKRKHGGTGLGLAIVQKLAREMGGTVTLQSEVGVGSTFTVLLPIQAERELA